VEGCICVYGGITRCMRNGFSLVELVIVACIIGILASLVVPIVQNKATGAKVAVAQDYLRVLRVAIKRYAAQHGGIAPGYEGNDPGAALASEIFLDQTLAQNRYLRKMPLNPFNNLRTISMIGNHAAFPPEATGDYGWVYRAVTETIHLDWPGVDDGGVRYFDY
jgi:prepilin-type N-terminal cleavage/methylation domain-containing protein